MHEIPEYTKGDSKAPSVPTNDPQKDRFQENSKQTKNKKNLAEIIQNIGERTFINKMQETVINIFAFEPLRYLKSTSGCKERC